MQWQNVEIVPISVPPNMPQIAPLTVPSNVPPQQIQYPPPLLPSQIHLMLPNNHLHQGPAFCLEGLPECVQPDLNALEEHLNELYPF